MTLKMKSVWRTRKKRPVFCGADRVAFAQDTAGSDADPRLIDIVSRVWILLRVDEGLYARALVRFQQREY